MCIGSSNYPKEENVDCLLRCWDLWIGQHVIWYCTLYFVLENRMVVIVHKIHSRINMWLLTKGLLHQFFGTPNVKKRCDQFATKLLSHWVDKDIVHTDVF